MRSKGELQRDLAEVSVMIGKNRGEMTAMSKQGILPEETCFSAQKVHLDHLLNQQINIQTALEDLK
jgi:hypothetical protein